MTQSEVLLYLGLPYTKTGFGPDSYNCWGLLIHIQKTYFNTEMPLAPLGDEVACLNLFKTKTECGEWIQTKEPKHGDCVLLKGGRNPHVGIYLDFDGGGVLHSLEGMGVIYSRLRELNHQGFGRTKFYKIVNAKS